MDEGVGGGGSGPAAAASPGGGVFTHVSMAFRMPMYQRLVRLAALRICSALEWALGRAGRRSCQPGVRDGSKTLETRMRKGSISASPHGAAAGGPGAAAGGGGAAAAG